MGDQTRAWNFPIQWARSFGEEIRFRTEIITSKNGTEQRIAQRAEPRVSYDFDSFLNQEDFRKALLRISEAQGEDLYFPHPRYCVTTTSETIVSDNTTRAVSFTIDDSGSMANDGKLATMKTAMTLVLENLKAKVQSGDLTRLDINITKWSDTSDGISYFDVTPAQMDTLITYIDDFTATGAGTDFDLAAVAADNFMTATLGTTLGRRIWVFISDGQPFPAGSDDTAAVTASDMLDRSADTFATVLGTDVDCHAINIQDVSTTAATKIDNTSGDGVPVVDAVDPDALLDYVLGAVSGESVSLSSAPGWVERGVRLFLEQDGIREMFTVARVNGTAVVSTEPFDNTFNPGAKVFRGIPGKVNGESELRAATTRVGLSRLEVDADPVDQWHDDWSAIPSTYNSKELFELGHQWATDIRVKTLQPVSDLDLQRGGVDRILNSDFTTRRTRLRFVLRTDDHYDRLIGLFYRSRGRQKSFYSDLFLDEIRPDGIALGNSFVIPGADFARQYSGNDTYRRIKIDTTSFSMITVITQIQINVDGDSVVTIEDVFNTAATQDQIRSIKWLTLCRFETDSLNLDWITDGVAEVTVNIRTLEDAA